MTLAKKPRKRTTKEPRPLPSREEILAFVAEHPGKAGKREIARAFGIKGGDKIALKAILKRSCRRGRWSRRAAAALKRPGDLPAGHGARRSRRATATASSSPSRWNGREERRRRRRSSSLAAAKPGPGARRRRPRARPPLARRATAPASPPASSSSSPGSRVDRPRRRPEDAGGAPRSSRSTASSRY